LDISMHHSHSDQFAEINGCCNEFNTTCNSSIEWNLNESSSCVSVQDEFIHWLNWNGCWDSTKKFGGLANRSFVLGSGTNSTNVTCWETYPPCEVMNELCVYHEMNPTAHADKTWHNWFPNANQTIEKMLAALCRRNSGYMDDTGKCICEDSGSRLGPYCNTDFSQYMTFWAERLPIGTNYGGWFSPKSGLSALQIVGLVLLIVVFLALCFVLIRKRKQAEFFDSKFSFDRKGLRMTKYDRVSARDDESTFAAASDEASPAIEATTFKDNGASPTEDDTTSLKKDDQRESGNAANEDGDEL